MELPLQFATSPPVRMPDHSIRRVHDGVAGVENARECIQVLPTFTCRTCPECAVERADLVEHMASKRHAGARTDSGRCDRKEGAAFSRAPKCGDLLDWAETPHDYVRPLREPPVLLKPPLRGVSQLGGCH